MIDHMPWQFALPVATILWITFVVMVARAGSDRD